jgi:signal transduction histidine kinase/ActR/RegA family two-component response regulator
LRSDADAAGRTVGGRFHLSLRARLVLLVVVSIVPLVSFTLSRRYADYETAIERAAQNTKELSRSLAQAVERELLGRVTVLEVLALSARLHEGDLDAFRTRAEAIIAANYQGSNILLLREDGQEVLNVSRTTGTPLAVGGDLTTVRRAFQTGRPVISNVFKDPVADRFLISIDVPVRDASGRVIYVLSANPEVDAFVAVLRRQRLPSTWVSSIFDQQGVNVARTHLQERFIGQKAGPELYESLRSRSEGTLISQSLEGLTLVTGFSRTEQFGWTVSIGVPMEELTRPAIIAALRALTAGMGALALGIVLAIFLARYISGPMARLRLLASGARDVVADGSTGMREADDVADALRTAEIRRRQSEAQVLERTQQLEASNLALQSEIAVRRLAEQRAQAQLERLNLLHQITRAIGERQDIDSIFQVVVRSLEDQLPVDFACLCLYDTVDHALTVRRVGVKTGSVALELAMPERSRIDIDDNGLSRCVRGQLVYEPDISSVEYPFPQRLAKGGMRSLVVAPLQVESRVFGVLVVARVTPQAFASGECEFLRQLSEHVALAAHQMQLHEALQRAYDDLRQTQQTVMQQERLRALGQMASGIAHDINNALSPVALYTETLLEREAGLSQRTRDYLETIQRAVEDVSQTVARMREFYRARQPQLDLAPVSLNLLIQQVIDLTRARWSDLPMQRGVVVNVRADLAANLAPVLGVESEIREALINLILNAVDALPEGGNVVLRTTIVEPASKSEPAAVHIEVIDDGLGMDEETRRRCMEPFFTTKGERGTGLGLAMVFGVVQRHGADMEIESSPGKGTTVRIRFAAHTETTAHASTGRRETPSLRRLRLLLVDDDPLLLKSLRETLEMDGHVIVAANDGASGIAVFRAAVARNEPFDAVITDLGMPNVDGRRVAAAVKEAAATTPVVLLTGWGQRLLSEDDIPAHVDRVLSKPPKLREIREALAQCCGPVAS